MVHWRGSAGAKAIWGAGTCDAGAARKAVPTFEQCALARQAAVSITAELRGFGNRNKTVARKQL